MTLYVANNPIANRTDLDEVREILRTHPAAKANLALLGDKRFLFNESR